MKRREFLVGSMSALAAGAAGPARISEIIVPSGSDITPNEMSRFLIELDGAMNLIAHDPAGGRFLRKLQSRSPAEEDATLFRQAMRTLLLVGNFGDLSVAGQVHPGVQKRLRYSAPEMDAAVLGLTDRMSALTPTARADIKSALSRDPALADRVLEAIDLEAASVGVPHRRRLQLRVMGKHIIRRLRQSSEMLVGEYVEKVRKLTSRPGTAAEAQRLVATRMGEAAFKARLQEVEEAARRWEAMELEEVPIGYERMVPPADADDDEPSDRWYRTGLRMMGIGAATTAVGWLLIGLSGDAAEGGAVGGAGVVLGVTVGPILLLISLVTLLIGGIIDISDGPGSGDGSSSQGSSSREEESRSDDGQNGDEGP